MYRKPVKPQLRHPLSRGEKSPESGQAIVLIAFIMVGLLAILGLSVDGGGILFLYRDARNATDASTLAAAYARCTDGDLVEAGLNTASRNGFNNDGTQNIVTVTNPPASGTGAGDSDYINVQIQAFKPSYFIHLVYPNPLWITTDATGFCREAFDSSSVGAIFGISNGCNQNGVVEISGANQNIIGDLFSNADTKQTGSGNGIVVDGNAGTVTTFDPPNYSDKVTFVPPSTYTPGVEPRDNPFDWVDMDDYRPGGLIWEALPEGQKTHHTGDWVENQTDNLSGFHMVEGDVTLRQITVDNTIGLTVVATGKINVISPNSEMKYYEPLLTLNDNDIPSVGFLFYSEFGTQSSDCSASNDAIDFSTNNINATGVLFAPNGGISGSFSDGFYKGALVGWRVSLSGSDSDIIRDPTLFPPQPPRVSIAD